MHQKKMYLMIATNMKIQITIINMKNTSQKNESLNDHKNNYVNEQYVYILDYKY